MAHNLTIMEFVKREILSRAFSNIPFFISEKLTQTNHIVPYYHIISDEEVLHIKHLYGHKNIKQFKEDLDFLIKKYNPISLLDILAYLKKHQLLPAKAFLLTFDDGFREMHDVVAPILLKKGIPATFFVNSAFLDNRELCYLHKASLLVEKICKEISPGTEGEVRGILLKIGISFSKLSEGILKIDYKRRDALDKIAEVLQIDVQRYLSEKQPYLTSGQVKELIDQGFTIGAHSIDHPYYSTLSLAEQLEQTIVSMKKIRENFGLDYGAFAFPHNDNNVSREFFAELDKSGLVDVSFGTGGMIKDTIPNNIQRCSLEKPVIPAKRIIAYQFARKLYRHMKGIDEIIRE